MVAIQIDALLVNVLDPRLHLFFVKLIHKKYLGSIFDLVIGNVRVLLHQYFFYFAFRSEIKLESCSLPKFTGRINGSSHLLNNLLTN